MASGYLYALANDSMTGIFKVGCTSRNPFERAKELRTTGVPTPFFLVAAVFVSDIKKAETATHVLLKSKGKRIQDDREFFETTLSDIVQVFAQIVSTVETTPLASDSSVVMSQLLRDAIIYHYGYQNTPPDIKQALKLYEQAAQMDSIEALGRLSFMYTEGSGIRKNKEKATYYANRAKDIADTQLKEYLIKCKNDRIKSFIDRTPPAYELALERAYSDGDIEGLRCIFPKTSQYPHNNIFPNLAKIHNIAEGLKSTKVSKSKQWLFEELLPIIPKTTVINVLRWSLNEAHFYSSRFSEKDNPQMLEHPREVMFKLVKLFKSLENILKTGVNYDRILLFKGNEFSKMERIDDKPDVVLQINSKVERVLR